MLLALRRGWEPLILLKNGFVEAISYSTRVGGGRWHLKVLPEDKRKKWWDALAWEISNGEHTGRSCLSPACIPCGQ